MRGVVTRAGLVVVLATAGCSVISGLSDLSVVDAGEPTAGDDGGSSSSSVDPDGAVPAPSAEAGADGSSQPSDSVDAGLDAPPTIVRCNGADCTGVCCIDPAGSATCAPPGQTCPSQRIALACDETSDCPAGALCCLRFAGTAPHAECSTSCGASGEVLCASGAECDVAEDCVPMSKIGFPPAHGKGACQ